MSEAASAAGQQAGGRGCKHSEEHAGGWGSAISHAGLLVLK